jgi:quercetin dioxygenase-like cupin family protein
MASKEGSYEPATGTNREPTHPGTDIAVIEGAEVGPGAGELIFENDRVRIMNIVIEPGQRSALHTHVRDYILVQINAGEACYEPHPESQGYIKERKVSATRPGLAAFIPAGSTEVAINTGDTPLREIYIELK